MNKHTLKVEKRELTGKKVKKLRKQGLLPGNIYGKGIESTSVQTNIKDFEAVYKETGASGLVELELGSEKRPVLIHKVQMNYLTNTPVHADFYQVNLKEKVKTMVPVVLTGEPKAVADKLGLLLQTLNEIEVEALPADLPENIEVDVTHLAAVGDQITVADVKKPAGIDILTEGEQVLAKIDNLVSKEAEEQAAAEAAASEEAKTEEGAAPESETVAAEEGKPAEAKEAPKEEAK